MKRRLTSFAIALAVAACATGAAAADAPAADAYPARPVSLIVGYAAGGPVDGLARLLAAELTKRMGRQFVVDNKPGAGGVLAAQSVAQAAPDGYQLYVAASPTLTISPHLLGKPPFDPVEDFTPITLVVDYSNVLTVSASSPYKNVAELVAAAKAAPGSITYGSAGVGGSNHLSGELLQSITKAPLTHVPYKGNAPAMTDVLGGQLTFMFDITSTASGYVQSGKARALAVTSTTRNRSLPDVPTMIEAGVPGFDVTGWIGLVGPPHLPDAIAARLRTTIAQALADPAFAQQLIGRGFDIAGATGDDYRARIRKDFGLWQKVVRDAGIPPQ